MMNLISCFYFSLFCVITASFQINLDLTEWRSDTQTDLIYQHDCLHVTARMINGNAAYQIISYCLGEWSSQWNIQRNTSHQNFTFAQLYKLNVTSEQLYIWSASIDVIERYQSFLNLSSSSAEFSLLGKQLFFNCTLPKFGTFCQYSLDIDVPNNLSLNELIYVFYQQEYKPMELTCYTNLACDRGSKLMCLDWSEICDQYIDCKDGIDEKNCWELQINQCNHDEYRCRNGQCIPIVYLDDDSYTFECLHQIYKLADTEFTLKGEPTFVNEDVAFPDRSYKDIYSELPITGSFSLERNKLLVKAMFSEKSKSVSDICWLAFGCILNEYYTWNALCDDLFPNSNCEGLKIIIEEHCPDVLFIPNTPVAFGHIYFAYRKNDTICSPLFKIPQYLCYNEQLCGGFDSNRTTLSFNNMTCRHHTDFPVYFTEHLINPVTSAIRSLYAQLFQCNTILYDDPLICNNSMMYRCVNSNKCISKYRLCDGTVDCDYKDDEECNLIGVNCSKSALITLFQCPTTGKCIHPFRVRDGGCQCGINKYGLCDDEITDTDNIRKQISFTTICDGFTELIPISFTGRNETDETDCEHWPCTNIYTQCDGIWNCLDGSDELDCNTSPLLNCSLHHRLCVSYERNELICLSIEKVNDGNIDCFGGMDEPKLCRAGYDRLDEVNFMCWIEEEAYNASSMYICYRRQCKNEIVEFDCMPLISCSIYQWICDKEHASSRSYIEQFVCEHQFYPKKEERVYFVLDRPQISIINTTNEDQNTTTTDLSPIETFSHQFKQRCHRGLPLHVWSNDMQNSTVETCLCPPSFYGSRCQYQNQRVSLTLRFDTYSDSRQTLFAIVVLLIDSERVIQSYQQLTYLYIRHCQVKFNIYLLYASRPKNQTKTYSIHIDIYEKISLKYRGSLLSVLKFSFLPVHRIALQLIIPHTNEKLDNCSNTHCLHGRCIQYSNMKERTTFCQCHQGWSGENCSIEHKCTCSFGSFCIGILPNNRSLCVCPIHKWGPQCSLASMICRSNRNMTCLNGGTCVAMDENIVSEKKYLCICSDGFSGDRCENQDAKLIISFNGDIPIPQYIFVHFIEIIPNATHENGSVYKEIPINQNFATVYRARPFHIAFLHSFNEYYLITVQKIFNRLAIISRTMQSADRCKHIGEVLNESIVQLHLIRRIKYYHVPCQNRSANLSCFHDDVYFCLCYDFGLQRLANCFEFDARKKLDCYGESNCQNGAQCLQDRYTCPQTSVCVCPECYFGTLCQFGSNLFGLSLDAILGYYIQPKIPIWYQPVIVQTGIALTIIMVLAGLINGNLSLLTFRNKETCQTGCGLYLFTASIVTLFTMIIFAMKFFILLGAQIEYMTNRTFLYIQCYSIDYFLQMGLNMDRWLGTCVAIERAISSKQGTSFNKQKSKKVAKYIIFILSMLIILTHIHDPIHRNVIDDNLNIEQRIWCIVTYSSSLQIYNTIINIIHFFVPFLVNLISPLIIIKMQIDQRLNVQREQTYRQIAYEQCHRHNHVIIGSIVLVILATPRLIISFISNCIKSNKNNTWLFLFGYFISFIPFILHFIVFVLPSKLFREEFQKCMKRYRLLLRRQLRRTL